MYLSYLRSLQVTNFFSSNTRFTDKIYSRRTDFDNEKHILQDVLDLDLQNDIFKFFKHKIEYLNFHIFHMFLLFLFFKPRK